MLLYHYTTMQHYLEIVVSGQINTTHSELLRPVNLHLNAEGTAWVDEATDDYKPVVWLTCEPNAKSEDYGNWDTATESKTEVRIAVEKAKDMYLWNAWRKANRMEEEWFEQLRSNMPGWRDVYVCERPIPTSDFVEVRIRVEAAKRFGMFESLGISEPRDAEYIYTACAR